MRISAFTIMILAVATIMASSPSRAQTYDPRYPVCMQVFGPWGGGYFDCSFTSVPQCQASASGRSAQCVINPFFAGAGQPPRRAWRTY